MNKKQENKLTMYEGVLSLITTNSEKTRTAGGFNESAAVFGALVEELKAKSIEVDSAAAGKTAVKYSAADSLIAALVPVCSALYVYGRKQGIMEIIDRAKITESKLRSMRDTELASFGTAISEMAEANAKEIEAHGIAQDKINDLKEKARLYSSAIGERESSVASRMGARLSVKELFRRADELLKEELDRYMELLRQSETEIYNKYFAARSIKESGIRHRQNGAEGQEKIAS